MNKQTIKQSVRSKDRNKIKRHWGIIESIFNEWFRTKPFCNRCKNLLPLGELEVGHGNYADYRIAELVCMPCHKKIDVSRILPSLTSVIDNKSYAKNFVILTFQKETSLMAISKKEGKKQMTHIFGNVPAQQEMRFTVPGL